MLFRNLLPFLLRHFFKACTPKKSSIIRLVLSTLFFTFHFPCLPPRIGCGSTDLFLLRQKFHSVSQTSCLILLLPFRLRLFRLALPLFRHLLGSCTGPNLGFPLLPSSSTQKRSRSHVDIHFSQLTTCQGDPSLHRKRASFYRFFIVGLYLCWLATHAFLYLLLHTFRRLLPPSSPFRSSSCPHRFVSQLVPNCYWFWSV